MKLNVMLLSLLLAASCSSKKKVDTTSDETGSSQKEELILNGSSDQLKAGGLRSVQFDFLSDQLTPTAKLVLESNRLYLEKNQTLSVQIEGHCDELGSAQFNLAFGERRAKIVRDYLQAKGIKKMRMTVISYGKERPLEEGISENSRAKNRRATFVVTGL